MTDKARACWGRALRTLATASMLTHPDPNSSASRAYYAAFYAVSALFALRGKTFTKHTAVQAAVHRDLVHTGLWTKEIGAQYSSLLDSRETGDYGLVEDVTVETAEQAVRAAHRILEAVKSMCPKLTGDVPPVVSE